MRPDTLIMLTIGLLALGLASVPVILITSQALTLLISASAMLVLVGVIILARAGRVNPGACLLLFVVLAGATGSIVSSPNAPGDQFLMILVILCASILLPPIHTWSALVLTLAGSLLAFGLLAAEFRDSAHWRLILLHPSQLLAFHSQRFAQGIG
ncbi:MAG: hypothetical protein SNJ69_10755 [Chloroflexaceae bacterium]